MTAYEVSHSLMGRPRKNGPGWLVLCPVHGDRHPSLSLRDGEGGRLLVKCFSGCDAREILKTLAEMGLLDGSPKTVSTPEEKNTDTKRKADRTSDLWNASNPITTGDPVWLYLKSRGIVLDAWPEDLRCHSSLGYWETSDAGKPIKTGVFPCLLAVVRSPQGRPVGIHRTWVRPDGSGKAPVSSPKKLFKVHDLSGSAIRLFSPENGTIGITEGLETALSVNILYGEPVWACVSAHGMASFVPPEGVSTVRVFADHDGNETGLKAALKSYDRLAKEGRTVEIRQPREIGDYNDELIKKPGLACWPDRAKE